MTIYESNAQIEKYFRFFRANADDGYDEYDMDIKVKIGSVEETVQIKRNKKTMSAPGIY